MSHLARLIFNIFSHLGTLVVLVILVAFAAPVAAKSKSKGWPQADWALAEKSLKKAKLPKDFVAFLKQSYDEKSFASTIRLNFLTFRRSPIQKNKTSQLSIRRSGAFLRAHRTVFTEAEERFGVSPEVISALIWMETQHGKLGGGFHVASVFVHLLQGERADVQVEVVRRASKEPSFKSLPVSIVKNIMRDRARLKTRWAMTELKALAKIYKRDPKTVKGLKGSFAGAFGWPQFIPSSYNDWAIAKREGRMPNLYRADDAILSVANYLKSHGWKPGDEVSHADALFEYNRSTDYANTILEIASHVKSRTAKGRGEP